MCCGVIPETASYFRLASPFRQYPFGSFRFLVEQSPPPSAAHHAPLVHQFVSVTCELTLCSECLQSLCFLVYILSYLPWSSGRFCIFVSRLSSSLVFFFRRERERTRFSLQPRTSCLPFTTPMIEHQTDNILPSKRPSSTTWFHPSTLTAMSPVGNATAAISYGVEDGDVERAARKAKARAVESCFSLHSSMSSTHSNHPQQKRHS